MTRGASSNAALAGSTALGGAPSGDPARGAGRLPAESSYDRAASGLITLLIFVGGAALVLLVVLLGNRLPAPTPAVPVVVEPEAGGVESGTDPAGMELVGPAADEVTLPTDLVPEPFQQRLQAITDELSQLPADWADPLGSEQTGSVAAGGAQGTGKAPAPGSGEGIGGYPRHQRWEIAFNAGERLDLYARQLDYFGIELGVVDASNQVVYGSAFASAEPRRRTGRREDEQRLYMTWTDASRRAADEKLLARAGISAAGLAILQFLPAEVENQLALLEREYRGRRAAEIRRTRFGLRAAGERFEFYVIEQQAW